MDRLILLRHGKALSDSESGEDFDRPLAPRGLAEAAAMGATLAARGFAPDLVLVSAAVRTRETWAAVAPAFGSAEVRFEDLLYHADARALIRFVVTVGEPFGTVMVVGHNPSLHELASGLMRQAGAPGETQARVQRQFPPAGAAVFDLDERGRPSAEQLFLPERHG